MSEVKERPILFSAPMILALLAGTKTQTRRVVKFTANGHVKEPGGHRRWHPNDAAAILACPYGKPGERLWVRESLTAVRDEHGYILDYAYKADGAKVPRCPNTGDMFTEVPHG